MSALPLKADKAQTCWHVCFVPIATERSAAKFALIRPAGRHFAERTLRNIWPDRVRHSALMLAARITLPHFSVSSAMSLLKSAGEPASAELPKSASRALILGSARPALISWLRFSTISIGVLGGAPMPYQLLAS